ncbi:Mbov_0396 family ICE element transmembrane protein [Mesomycoplasma conjunctivae]|uniref:Mbov_0396 family ICE element transmembrane protein n=1 Tax=Mesomycoplasma conjunctivae TaxID=45361 RepID=UPI003DA3F970
MIFADIFDWISYLFFSAAWMIFAWPFIIFLNIITTLFGSISFNVIKNMFFGSQENFSITKIPLPFWISAGLAATVLLFLIIYRLVKNFFLSNKKPNEYDSSIKNVIINTASAIIFPIIFIVLIFICFIGINLLVNGIKESLGYRHNLTLSLIRGAIGEIKLSTSDVESISKGNVMPFDAYKHLSIGDGPRLILLVAISTLIISWLLSSTLIGLVANLAQMFYQLILLPVFSVSKIIDDGRLFKKYMQAFWAKFWVVVIYQLSFSFFFIWAEYTVNQGYQIIKNDSSFKNDSIVSNSLLNFFLSFVFILGGGVAIKTIGEEFAGYFGSDGFVRSQQEWARRTLKGVAFSAGAITGAGILAKKGFIKGQKLTGFHDFKKAEIKARYKKGEISRTEKRAELEQLRADKIAKGQTFREGWNNTDGNVFKKLYSGVRANRESKDLGLVEEAGFLGSRLSMGVKNWQKNRAEKALQNDPKNSDDNTKLFQEAVEKKTKSFEKQKSRFSKRQDNLYETVHINHRNDALQGDVYKDWKRDFDKRKRAKKDNEDINEKTDSE